ncbi:hypothetical protein BKA70DRAFT_1446765 [Coprinopsis sp. MPI-PUGE-AT-0042]|nr:hypothetical protein BKA70DRAFT_1446765 [Coprinopsis sp. MPI-PUGE-AT-0042]
MSTPSVTEVNWGRIKQELKRKPFESELALPVKAWAIRNFHGVDEDNFYPRDYHTQEPDIWPEVKQRPWEVLSVCQALFRHYQSALERFEPDCLPKLQHALDSTEDYPNAIDHAIAIRNFYCIPTRGPSAVDARGRIVAFEYDYEEGTTDSHRLVLELLDEIVSNYA